MCCRDTSDISFCANIDFGLISMKEEPQNMLSNKYKKYKNFFTYMTFNNLPKRKHM